MTQATSESASRPDDGPEDGEVPEPDDAVDRVIAQTFPASDPPSWWAGASGPTQADS
jgi:hypothetical protein